MRWGPVPYLLGTFILLIGCRRHPDDGANATNRPGTTAKAPSAPAPKPSPPELTLVYSADFRGQVWPQAGAGVPESLARRATLLDRIRLESGTVVQVDGGDILAGPGDPSVAPSTPYAVERRTQIVLSSYARMGVDVATLGERDLALGPERLHTAVEAAKLSVVAANLFTKAGERPFPADQIVDAAGLLVGVFGVLDVTAPEAADLRRVGFHTGDAVEAALASAQSLRRRGARLVVGLLHVTGGSTRVREILAGAPGIDVAVWGHAGDLGTDSPTGTNVGRTRLLRVTPSGAAIGRLDVRGLHAGNDPHLDDRTLLVTMAVPAHTGVALIERAEIERARDEKEKAATALRHKNRQPEPGAPSEIWNYSSNGACQMCHEKQVEQWKTTDHAQALATLAKRKHDLDPACLGCHTTGYLQPGGTRSIQTLTTYFANVGCESCHGPSVEHVRSLDKKKGTSRTVGPEVCLGCHTSDKNIGPFDYATALKQVQGPEHGAPTLPAGNVAK
jgi:hypothetical protein